MTRPTVLVGLDDSAAARAALAWAARYCRRTVSALRAVNVLQFDLLVVGTQEHVGLRRAVLGSVSHYCLHARCPVVAVPR